MDEQQAVARIIRERSRSRCECVGYHKVYAVSEACAADIAREILTRPQASPAAGPVGDYVMVPRQRFAAALTVLSDAAKNAGIGDRKFVDEMEGYLASPAPVEAKVPE